MIPGAGEVKEKGNWRGSLWTSEFSLSVFFWTPNKRKVFVGDAASLPTYTRFAYQLTSDKHIVATFLLSYDLSNRTIYSPV